MMTKKWTTREKNLLKKGILPPKRSNNSIKVMRQRLGIVAYKVPRWTVEHKEMLKSLLSEGKSTKEISAILPYTVRSIQKEIVRQRIPHTSQCRFTRTEKDIFEKFLKDNWKQKTPQDLVDLWNQSNKRKVNHRKVVVYLKRLNIKISKSEVMKITLLRKKEQNIIAKSDTDRTKEIDKVKEARIRIMSERFSQGKDIWTGLKLPECNEDLELDVLC
jgi:hypothetical protein